MSGGLRAGAGSAGLLPPSSPRSPMFSTFLPFPALRFPPPGPSGRVLSPPRAGTGRGQPGAGGVCPFFQVFAQKSRGPSGGARGLSERSQSRECCRSWAPSPTGRHPLPRSPSSCSPSPAGSRNWGGGLRGAVPALSRPPPARPPCAWWTTPWLTDPSSPPAPLTNSSSSAWASSPWTPTAGRGR